MMKKSGCYFLEISGQNTNSCMMRLTRLQALTMFFVSNLWAGEKGLISPSLKERKTRQKEISVKELVKAYQENIKSKNEELNIFLEVFDDIDDQVEKAQAVIDAGEARSLTGIPIAFKDNICIKGRKASAASRYLGEYVAPYNATVTDKLVPHSPVFLGRVNMDEFAMGGSTENSAFGVAKNPHDTSRVSGGSSGGSAAAVAADFALFDSWIRYRRFSETASKLLRSCRA